MGIDEDYIPVLKIKREMAHKNMSIINSFWRLPCASRSVTASIHTYNGISGFSFRDFHRNSFSKS